MTEIGGQGRDRNLRTEVGGRRTEDRGRKSEVRGQKRNGKDEKKGVSRKGAKAQRRKG